MNLELLNSVFGWTAIIGAILTAIAVVGSWWTGSILDARKAKIIAGLERKITELEPRTVTSEQRKQLTRRLAGMGGMVGFVAKMFDPEAKAFAEQLASAFKDAGWAAIEPINTQLLDDFGGKLNIIVVATGISSKDQDLERTSERLCSELSAIGIPCQLSPIRQGSIGGHMTPGAIYILVGARPVNG